MTLEVGKRLREEMDRLGYPIKKFARALGISPMNVKQMLHAKEGVRNSRAQQLEALGVDMQYYYKGQRTPSPAEFESQIFKRRESEYEALLLFISYRPELSAVIPYIEGQAQRIPLAYFDGVQGRRVDSDELMRTKQPIFVEDGGG